MYFLAYSEISCGGIIEGMSSQVPILVSLIINIIKIAVPIILVIFGMLDLAKAVMAQKDDEIKKSQQTFLKRLVSAVLVFFVISIVQLVFKVVTNGDEDNAGVWDCFNCFVNGPSETAKIKGGECR